jgi:hypothetical protein
MKRNRHPFNARERFAVRAVVVAGAVAVFAALAGCGSSPPLFSPDGRPTTQVQCSTAAGDACEQQARGMCGGAFDVVRQTTEKSVRNLLFACKAG